MKYVVLVQTKYGQRTVQVQAPKDNFSLLVFQCMESIKVFFNV